MEKKLLGILICTLLIVASTTMIIGTTVADWDPGDDCKWAQLPDLSPFGMDVDMTSAPLADDFLCTDSSPILDIHFWGSFARDILPARGPGSLEFQISIHADIPAGVEAPWSMPGEVLWTRVFTPGQYTWRLYHEGLEDWYNPATGIWWDDNHLLAYQYNFYIDESEAFVQEEGTIYWLSIKDLPPTEPDYTFGWKTCEFDQRWNDDATWQCDPPSFWCELRYPIEHPYADQSLDLAFVITGVEEEEPLGNMECEKKVWDLDTQQWVEEIHADIGDTVRFKITITYNGPYTLYNIKVKDILPPCLKYVNNAIPEEPEISGNILYWNLSTTLTNGQSTSIEFDTLVILEGTNINLVNITADECSGEILYCEDIATVIVEPPAPDIELRKYVKHISQWAGYTEVNVGDIVEFKIVVTNTGNIDLHSVVVEDDLLPTYLTYNYDANHTPTTATDQHIEWNLGTMTPQQTIEITFTADADAAGTQECNYAIVTTQEGPFDEDIACVDVEQPGDKICEKKVWDSDTQQWVEEIHADIGDTVRFKITITYNGPYTLYNIKVKDILPPCLKYVNNAIPEEPEISGNILYWNLSTTLTNGQSTSIEFDTLVISKGTNINLVNITADECSGETLYCEDTATVIVEAVCYQDIELTKYVNNDGNWEKSTTVNVGENVQFKILIENTGTMLITSLFVKDDLPTFLTFNNDANHTPSSSTDHHIQWDFNNLGVGETIEITFSAHADAPGEDDNYANVTTYGGPTDDDTAHVIVEEIPCDMICEKKVWDSDTQQWVEEIHADIGDTVRFNITITYFGDSILTDIKVRDTLPSCLEYADNAIPEEPEISGNILYWNLSDWLNNGQSISIEFDARVISGGVNVNIANITAFNCGPQLVYCEDDATVIVEGAPLIANADGPYEEIAGKPVQFYGSATGGTGPYSWYWDFGDGKNSTLQNPTHVYSEGGVYIVNLTVTDYYGINDSDNTTATILLNAPPDKPSTPSGTTHGTAGTEYTYTSSTTDPDGDQVWYWFDWDDGTNSGWIGPYASGATGSAKHTWDEEGDYDIKVKAKDVYEQESDWSNTLSVEITKIEINLSIRILSFGFGRVRATITNMGEEDVDDVTWDMFAEWGSILKKNVSDSGTIGTMNIGDKVGISTGEILGDGSIRRGFGKITVTVTVTVPDEDPITEQATGFVIGKLVIIL